MACVSYQIRQCTRLKCKLRYPWSKVADVDERCPRCGGSTQLVLMPQVSESIIKIEKSNRNNSMQVLLDNIRSAWNVGSIFRTADGVGIKHIHLCGITPTPENPKVVKTALGAENTVSWNYSTNNVEKSLWLKEQGLRIWALEWHEKSVSINDIKQEMLNQPVVLVVGNEISGVDPGVLELCEHIIYVPMKGVKQSFNVAVVFGIAAYYFSCCK